VSQSNNCVEALPPTPTQKSLHSLKAATAQIHRYGTVLAAIHWADVVHWHYGGLLLREGFDLRWARFLAKPGVVEFWGSDIRIPEVDAADNPYYAGAWPDYEYREESFAHSRRTQEQFSRAGFDCLVGCKSMLRYVQRDLFAHIHIVRPRVLLSDFVPSPPDPGRKRPLVVHSPTAPVAKGTAAVLRAVDELKRNGGLKFDFRLIQNMPRQQALDLVKNADVFLDQFVLGVHGLAALEAMALAKPVFGYIKPSMVNEYPPDLPIVNANQENLATKLGELIRDGALRRELGLRGRAYVEKHHDALKLAQQLKTLYQELLDRRRRV
jgi:glycosyltransferase involved in cell wall biosynthesis